MGRQVTALAVMTSSSGADYVVAGTLNGSCQFTALESKAWMYKYIRPESVTSAVVAIVGDTLGAPAHCFGSSRAQPLQTDSGRNVLVLREHSAQLFQLTSDGKVAAGCPTPPPLHPRSPARVPDDQWSRARAQVAPGGDTMRTIGAHVRLWCFHARRCPLARRTGL